MQYSHKQLHLMDKYLLRKLKVGEHFKALDKLTKNYNEEMEEHEGSWLTVKQVRSINYVQDSDDFYIENGRETIYHAKEEDTYYGGDNNWHPYHMDIKATNQWILKNDNISIYGNIATKENPHFPMI